MTIRLRSHSSRVSKTVECGAALHMTGCQGLPVAKDFLRGCCISSWQPGPLLLAASPRGAFDCPPAVHRYPTHSPVACGISIRILFMDLVYRLSVRISISLPILV